MSSTTAGPTWHEDPEEDGADVVVFHEPPAVVENRHRRAKKAGTIALSATGKAVTASQFATHSSTTAAATALATGAAVSATGIGLAAVAGAAMLTNMAFAGTSAVKSGLHKKKLQEIYNDRKSMSGDDHCAQILEDGTHKATDYSRAKHNQIVDLVLPYAIFQKTKKTAYKSVAALPVLGALAPIYALANKWGKAYRGELGKKRTKAAQALAEHLISCDCDLANAIVAELCSAGEAQMEGLRDQEYAKLTEELALKLKST